MRARQTDTEESNVAEANGGADLRGNVFDMVHVLDGEAEITISGEPKRVAAGQMIVMPADEPHALSAIERFKMVLVMLKS